MKSTSADNIILGFEYQFYYFLLELLRMEKNSSVGFEVKDDVHIENGDTLSLIQLKHTQQTNQEGNPKNLVDSDTDIWKTLSNWIDIIKNEKESKRFIDKTNFIFVTNKSISEKNIFYKSFIEFKESDDLTKFKNSINIYNSGLSSENQNKAYIKKLVDLDENLLDKFLKKTKFVFEENGIIQDIKEEIKYRKSMPENRVENVFHELTGLYKELFYETVKNKKIFLITHEEFYLKTLAIFKKMRSNRLIFKREFEKNEDESILQRIFARQLSDIDVEQDQIFEADYNRIAMETNLQDFIQESEITPDDIELLDDNTITSWKEEFDAIYSDELNRTIEKAQELYYSVLRKDLMLSGEIIEWKVATKGQFIRISDIPNIGWKYEWEKDYSNEE